MTKPFFFPISVMLLCCLFFFFFFLIQNTVYSLPVLFLSTEHLFFFPVCVRPVMLLCSVFPLSCVVLPTWISFVCQFWIKHCKSTEQTFVYSISDVKTSDAALFDVPFKKCSIVCMCLSVFHLSIFNETDHKLTEKQFFTNPFLMQDQ